MGIDNVGTIRCHSERSEESPQWQYTMNVIANTHYVILNVVKNLSESTDVRLLCYPVDASLSLSMT